MAIENQVEKTIENPVEKQVEKPRVHKKFGKYLKCKISYKQENKKNVSIFASVNSYTLECQQDTEVYVPEEIIKMLKAATYTTYFYDEAKKSHNSKEEKKYFVELC